MCDQITACTKALKAACVAPSFHLLITCTVQALRAARDQITACTKALKAFSPTIIYYPLNLSSFSMCDCRRCALHVTRSQHAPRR